MTTRLDQFAALEAAATPAPWAYTQRYTDKDEFWGHWHEVGPLSLTGNPRPNTELIAAARNLAPHLIRLARVADDCADKLALLRDLSDTEAYVSRALNAALAPLLAEVRE